MRERIKFFIVDVFGESKYSGNQLAVFLNAASVSGDEMQQITREINFSETTFILSDQGRDGGYDVRIFTPGAEIDFAGHPTLGTAYVIRKYIIRKPVEKVILNLKVGKIPVKFPLTDETVNCASGITKHENRSTSVEQIEGPLWMEQVEPEFGRIFEPTDLAPVFSLEEYDFDRDHPIQEVSTGLPQIIVPLRSIESLKRIKVDLDSYYQLIKTTRAKVILAFCPGGYTSDQKLGVRVFPIALGISEDPATGSGNGCLAAWLIKNRYLESDKIDITVGQGYEIGRPSQIYLRAAEREGRIQVEVGGRVITIAEGFWD